MSYILDAIKKMEREKVKKTRSGGMISISGELFREERPRPSAGGAWKIVVAAVVTSCLAMTATWYYLKPDKTSEMPAQRGTTAVVPSPRPPSVPATPATPVIPVQHVPVKPLAESPPAQPPVQATLHSVQQTQAASQARTTAPQVRPVAIPAAQPAPRKLEARKKEHLSPPVIVQPVQRPAVATITPPADIKVSGIAWQEEHGARRAVINGFLMKEGGMVSGARITEILQDRVRFSTASGQFELSMVASGIPGAAK